MKQTNYIVVYFIVQLVLLNSKYGDKQKKSKKKN